MVVTWLGQLPLGAYIRWVRLRKQASEPERQTITPATTILSPSSDRRSHRWLGRGLAGWVVVTTCLGLWQYGRSGLIVKVLYFVWIMFAAAMYLVYGVFSEHLSPQQRKDRAKQAKRRQRAASAKKQPKTTAAVAVAATEGEPTPSTTTATATATATAEAQPSALEKGDGHVTSATTTTITADTHAITEAVDKTTV